MRKSLGLAAALMAATASSAGAETLILADGYPPAHQIAAQGIEPWMACVKESTKGRVDFNYFPSGQIVSFKNAIDSLNQGLAQISVILVAYESSRLPLNGIGILPYMGNSSTEMVKAYRSMLGQPGPLADEFAAVKVHPLLVNLLPPYQIMSTSAPVDTIEKFKGIKVRVGGGAMNFMAASLGASPVEIGGADMYVSMQRGTVDATFLTLSSVKSYGLEELVKSMSGNGAFGSGTTVLAMDQKTWEGLAPVDRKAIDECSLKVEMDLAQKLDAANEKLKAEFADLGINVYKFSDEENAAIAKHLESVAEDYLQRLRERGLDGDQVYKDYRTALEQ